jgi:isopenicillin N synthase-like dioxygenase
MHTRIFKHRMSVKVVVANAAERTKRKANRLRTGNNKHMISGIQFPQFMRNWQVRVIEVNWHNAVLQSCAAILALNETEFLSIRNTKQYQKHRTKSQPQ